MKEHYTLDLVIEYTRTYCDIKMGREQEKELKRERIDEVYQFSKRRYRPNNNYTERNKELLHVDKGCHKPSDDFIQRNKDMLYCNKGLPTSTRTERALYGFCGNSHKRNSLNVNLMLSNTNINIKVDAKAYFSVMTYECYQNISPIPMLIKSKIKLLLLRKNYIVMVFFIVICRIKICA